MHLYAEDRVPLVNSMYTMIVTSAFASAGSISRYIRNFMDSHFTDLSLESLESAPVRYSGEPGGPCFGV